MQLWALVCLYKLPRQILQFVRELIMTKLVLTRGVREYRATIPFLINRKDIVLEIGFAWGTTTNLLYQAAKKVVGIDKGESYYTAIKSYPWIELHKIDGFDIRSVMALGHKFNKIYIDISGCRDIHSVIKMVNMYKAVFKPELIVVKSTQLKKFVQQCKVWND